MWLEDLVTVLSPSVAVFNTNFFAGLKPVVPQGAGPYLVVRVYGGGPPDWIHNTTLAAHEKPAAQVQAIAMAPQDAETLSYSAWKALQKWNVTINGVLYRWIKPVQSPFEMPLLDPLGRTMWNFNITGDKSLS